MSTLYEDDPTSWADDQIEALQRLARMHPELLDDLDIGHLVEELDEMRKSVARELTSRLAVILLHLAKWRWQPGRCSRSWAHSVAAQRDRIALLLHRNPGARPHLAQAFEDAWYLARRDAHRETGLAQEVFPETCPFIVDDVLQEGWLPD